jgi:hypothetical protein
MGTSAKNLLGSVGVEDYLDQLRRLHEANSGVLYWCRRMTRSS